MSRRRDRDRIKKVIEKVLEEHGELRQSELKEKLWKDYDADELYKTKQSLAQTLSNVKSEMLEENSIETERVEPKRGSLMTDKWRLQ